MGHVRGTTETQQAGRKGGNQGQQPKGQETSGEVSSAPREDLKLLEDLLRPKIRRSCPFWDVGSSSPDHLLRMHLHSCCSWLERDSGCFATI